MVEWEATQQRAQILLRASVCAHHITTTTTMTPSFNKTSMLFVPLVLALTLVEGKSPMPSPVSYGK
jgi:hypothetical protein